MIPAEFEYERPSSIADAVGLLERHGEGAKLLAGGHSLIPLMKLRLAAPETLIDLSGIPDLSGIREDGDVIAIGALTTHRAVAESELLAGECPVLAEAAAGVGDMQVRNRGTIGGSIAHADPHADLPAVLVALGGEVVAEGSGGRRTIAADELFLDYMTTSISADEILTEVRVPKVRQSAYVKFNRRMQDWAVVGVAVAIVGSQARIAITGVASRPVRATAAEQAWDGSNPEQAAKLAGEGLAPASDTAASAEYRVHLATVLTRRALEAAASR
ncbi:MAG: aerobic carbon-monoxide dehydrogenase medium subunit [Gaiellales bacterium]|nr:aerobic carbon-monoxide dehydrogenase medium subunit [Gaiellales bacterium]